MPRSRLIPTYTANPASVKAWRIAVTKRIQFESSAAVDALST